METALITWIVIAAFAIIMLIYDIFHHRRKKELHKLKFQHLHPIELGKECDELYIPGDINSCHDSDVIEYDEELV